MVLAVTPVEARIMVVASAVMVLAAVPVWIAIVVAREKQPMTIAMTVSAPVCLSVPIIVFITIMVFITMVVPNEMAMEVNLHIAGLDHGGHGHTRRD
jgi:hypothetical protein